MNCRVEKPYPVIQVEKENVEYAKILLEDYAGEGGEDTAIHEYLYQSITQVEITNTLKEIAIVEMHHLRILGELIWKLGYPPSFYTIDSNIGCYLPWTSSYLNYSLDIHEAIMEDIERERKTIQRYQKHIEMIDDHYIQDILTRIIEDEQMHITCLRKICEEL